jgi:hypothetical protein
MLSPFDIFQISKVKQQLFNVDKFKTVRVSSDQTLQQRKLYSLVASELKLRKDAGETDFFLLNMLITVRQFQKNGQLAKYL